MISLRLTSALAALGAASLLSLHAAQPVETGAPGIIPHRTRAAAGQAPTAGSTSATSPILYRGGPVMGGTPNIYIIWYGNWNQTNGTDTPAGQQIVRDFLAGLGGSPYLNINTTYSISSTPVTNLINYAGQTTDTGSQGTTLSDTKILSVVKAAIPKLGNGNPDPNGIYFVLTSSNVSVSSGFCTRYCGWHTYTTVSNTTVKYSFVGNAARCLSACAAQSVGPNGNAGVDGMLSVLAHELVETVSDPKLNAWYDANGAENADKCAWTFGTTYLVNGAYANMQLGSRHFLIQRNLFHGASGDYCAVGYSNGVLTK